MGVQVFSHSFLLPLFFLNAMFGIDLPFVSSRHCAKNQLHLLLELKNHLIYDSSFSKLVQWNESTDCCRWYSVKCDFQGRVIGLDLQGEGITGGIHEFAAGLYKLQFLQSLNLAFNDFGGVQLPPEIGRLAGLNYLNIRLSNFSGQIPAEFSNLARLVVLDLFSDYDTLMNPDSYTPLSLENPDLKTLIHNFTLLRELYLDGVNISANGYQWCNAVSSSLPNLRALSLINTSITGPFHPSLAKLQSLSVIGLDKNNFSSPFPDFFADFSNLTVLRLSSCNLSGVTPQKLFQITTLETIDLSRNEFLEGSLPESIGNLTQLTWLDLSYNRFNGRLPSFASQKNLTYLDLSFNRFYGSVDLTDFGHPTALVLSHNNLSVSINQNVPVSSYLPQLEGLALASCNLQKLPPLQNISSLVVLDLSDNKLYGEIPNWIWEIGDGYGSSLLNLSHNQFISLQEPYAMDSPSIIDLHSNMIGGQIPILHHSVTYVDFSNNNFSSVLSDNIMDSLSSINFFSMANNNINGTIPFSLCNATSMEFLDLSNNSFHGRIPSCLVALTLTQLNLSNNNLSGEIPNTFPADCRLEALDLGLNNLRGKIPISLSRCSLVQVLNLGHNSISDTFPCSFKNLPRLHVLDLHSNEFHGNINCSYQDNSTWQSLQIIDLASNDLNGILPRSLFQSMKALMVDVRGAQSKLDYLHSDSQSFPGFYQYSVTVIAKGQEVQLVRILTTYTLVDFSNNHFQGVIPETVSELKYLHFLNFSRNDLSGHIPSSVEKLRELESLDLSFNHLDGEIPQQLASLTFLAFLNLSYNKVVGRIPLGGQMTTFEPSSFQGNEGLCGIPLNRSCTSPEVQQTRSGEEHECSDNRGIYISAELGFIVGLGVLYLPLLFSIRWRRFFIKQLDKVVLFILRRR